MRKSVEIRSFFVLSVVFSSLWPLTIINYCVYLQYVTTRSNFALANRKQTPGRALRTRERTPAISNPQRQKR